jgi:hypothetical protein
MMARLLQTKVTRTEESISGLTRYTFHIATMAATAVRNRPAPEPELGIESARSPDRAPQSGLLDKERDSLLKPMAHPARQTSPTRLTTPIKAPRCEEETLLAMPQLH